MNPEQTIKSRSGLRSMRHLQCSTLVLSSLLLALATSAQSRPPTVDPTYGLPLPKTPSRRPPVTAADWIWTDVVRDNQTLFLRRTLTLTRLPKTATLYITADDFFTLFINGKQVDQSRADPKDNNVWQHVHHINIAPLLRTGVNVLAVRGENVGGAAGVIARLEIPGRPAVETDAQWKALASPTAPGGWNAPMFDDSQWATARVEAAVTGQPWSSAGGLEGWPGYDAGTPYFAHVALHPVAVESLPQQAAISGAAILTGRGPVRLRVQPSPVGSANPPGVLLDFGKEVAGRIALRGTPGAQVQVATGESREECLKAPWGGPHLLALDATGAAASPYSAFRYARLNFFGAAPYLLTGVTLDDKYYPVSYKGSFDCSDPLLTKIWYTGAYTAHLCMQEDIWDAPKRDRARWVGDLHVSGEVIDDVFADRFLMEQTLTRLRDDAQGGRPYDQLPNSHVNGIPGYSCAWICCLADFHRHIGDIAFLQKQHAPLLSLLAYMRGELDEQGVFANKRGQWPFVDWSPGFDGNTPLALATTHLFYVKAAREAVFLLRAMGDTVSADKYAAWADALTTAARRYLPDAATQTYGTRLQENAMAVYSGAATPAQTAVIAQNVLNPGSAAWDKTGAPPYNPGVITPYYSNYVIYALSRAGRNEDALRLLRGYWGGMLAEGATTFWEAYDPHWPKQDFHANLYADGNHGYYVSLCHGWSSGPTSWLTERVLGVRPTSGGFVTAEIAPDLGDLRWAEGNVPTPRGLLHVRAQKQGSSLDVRVTLPPGVAATVSIPGTTVLLDGKTAPTVGGQAGRRSLTLRKPGTYLIRSLMKRVTATLTPGE